MTRLSAWCVHSATLRPWRTLMVWLACLVALFGLAAGLGNNRATNADYGTGEAGKADALLAATGLGMPASEFVMITPNDGDQNGALAVANQAVKELTEAPDVIGTDSVVASTRTSAVLVGVQISGDPLTASKRLDGMREVAEGLATDNPDMAIEVGGRASRSAGLDAQRSEDLLRTEGITIPIAIIVLIVALSSVSLALIPVMLAVASIVGAMGLAALGSQITPDVGVGMNVIILLGLAVMIDYALYFVMEHRAARREADPRAGERAAARAGNTVMKAGAAIAAAAACLYLGGDVVLSSLATCTIAVALAAVGSSLTALPAMIELHRRLMARVARGKKVIPQRPRSRAPKMPVSLRRPWATLIVVSGALVVASLPVLGMRLETPGTSTFTTDVPEVRAYEAITASFPELGTQQIIVVAGPPGQAEAHRSAVLESVRGEVADRYNLDLSRAIVTSSSDGSVTRVVIGQPDHTDGDWAIGLMRQLRDQLAPQIADRFPETQVLISGDAAQNEDKVTAILDAAPRVIVALIVMIAFVTAISFRSATLAVIGVVLTCLTATSTLGITVALAQGPWQPWLAAWTPDYIALRVPILLAVILFGITIDYQYFVLSAIAEKRRGLPLVRAIEEGLRESRTVIISAAIVMMLIFAAFISLGLVEMRQIGFALALSVLLDAIVIRSFLLPAILNLLGDRFWPARRSPMVSTQSLPTPVVARRLWGLVESTGRLPSDRGTTHRPSATDTPT